jgi:hypothetical protein
MVSVSRSGLIQSRRGLQALLLLVVAVGGWPGEFVRSASLPSDPGVAALPAPVGWGTGAGKWQGFWGRRETVLCPTGGEPELAWGTDVYTDDSSICTAAVHAGLITPVEGGPVTIEMRPDQGQYGGSTRNGVTTHSWMDPWTGSFVFVWGSAAAAPAPAIYATGQTQADSWAGHAGRVITFLCPPLFELHTVHGTDVYTDDSYVCTAAAHAGVISHPTGGLVTIKLLPGPRSLTGSTRNGITSYGFNSWQGQCFAFVATPPGTPPPPTADTPYLPPPARSPMAPPQRIEPSI